MLWRGRSGPVRPSCTVVFTVCDDDAELNMNHMLVTLDTSHLERSPNIKTVTY